MKCVVNEIIFSFVVQIIYMYGGSGICKNDDAIYKMMTGGRGGKNFGFCDDVI